MARCERGHSKGVARFSAFAILSLIAARSPVFAAPMTNDQKCAIIKRDIKEYLSTGHPCPCPYSINRKGAECGHWAAWAKPNGRAPRCYFGDVDGTIPPNLAPHPTRKKWPDPPPCDVLS
jgi:hypothetical protein